MPLVKIKSGMSHGYRDAATGALAYHQAGDEFDATPAEVVSFGDKFEAVSEDAPDENWNVTEITLVPVEDVDATPGARKLAQEHGISLALSGIVGTGKAGKITKADLEALLNGDAQ